ncbi:hypothetical protein MRX96_029486 [Rhipicephalus microplus]
MATAASGGGGGSRDPDHHEQQQQGPEPKRQQQQQRHQQPEPGLKPQLQPQLQPQQQLQRRRASIDVPVSSDQQHVSRPRRASGCRAADVVVVSKRIFSSRSDVLGTL